jgi:hypothetical protein
VTQIVAVHAPTAHVATFQLDWRRALFRGRCEHLRAFQILSIRLMQELSGSVLHSKDILNNVFSCEESHSVPSCPTEILGGTNHANLEFLGHQEINSTFGRPTQDNQWSPSSVSDATVVQRAFSASACYSIDSGVLHIGGM